MLVFFEMHIMSFTVVHLKKIISCTFVAFKTSRNWSYGINIFQKYSRLQYIQFKVEDDFIMRMIELIIEFTFF